MADIFGNSSPPAWLVNAAKPASGRELGQFLGDQMSILALAMQRDPKAPEDASWMESRRGIADAQTDVQNSKIDPMWKQNRDIKLGQWALQTQGKILQNDLTKATLDARAAVTRDEADDQVTFAKAMADVGTDTKKLLNYTMPPFKSAKYASRWVQARTGAAASLDGIEEKQRIVSDVKQALSDHNAVRDALGQLDPTERATVGEPKGKNGTYTSQQMFAVNDMLKAAGKPLIGEKQYKPLDVVELNRQIDAADAAADTEGALALRADRDRRIASKSTVAIKNVEQASKWEDAAVAAEKVGDAEGAKKYRDNAEALKKASGRTPFPSTQERQYNFYKRLESSPDSNDRLIAKHGMAAIGSKGTMDSGFRKKQTSLLTSSISSLNRRIAGEESKPRSLRDNSKIKSYRAQVESAQLEIDRLNPKENDAIALPNSEPNPSRFKVEVLPTE